MVIEYLDGCTLAQYLGSVGSLDAKMVLQLLVPVADALRACHAVGLIHRGVSPDNIFVTADGRIKLLDFGAARFASGPRSTNLSVILQEGYAPFEQYQRNGRQGPWTDIYALTGTLYRLLTGELPVAAPDRVAGTRLPSPAEKGVKISPSLQALLDKGLAVQPEERYQKVDDFLSDLRATLGRAPVLPVPLSRRRRKRPVTLIGSVGLVGVVGTFVVVWLNQTTPPPGPVAPPVFDPADPTKNEAVAPPRLVAPPANPPKNEAASRPPISISEYIKKAVQDQIQLRLAITQASKDQEDSLNKYMADVALLAREQDTAVDTAIQLEEDNNNIANIDPRKAVSKAQISSAINQLKTISTINDKCAKRSLIG
jgi:serine/threonine protein kinase